MCTSVHAWVFHGIYVEEDDLHDSVPSCYNMGLGDETQVAPGLAASAFNPLNHLTDSEKHFLKYLAGLGMGLTGTVPT